MHITVQLGATVRQYSQADQELSLQGGTVRELLTQLEIDHPAVYNAVCHENGDVRPHVNLFVNSSVIDKGDDLNAPLSPGDVVSIMHAVSGG